jgi:hypothetical protein
MFNGTQPTGSSNFERPDLYTGLANMKILGINPSQKQIEEWLERPYNMNVDYSKIQQRDRLVRPINIWLKSVDEGVNVIERISFFASNQVSVTSTGKTQYVNSKGEFVYSESTDDLNGNEKMTWFTKHPFRAAYEGEREIYSFIQMLIGYSSKNEDASFMDDAEKNGIAPTFTSDGISWPIYDGELKGLEDLVKYCEENGDTIALLLTVKKQEKGTATYFNQGISSNVDAMGRKADTWTTNKLKERHAKRALTNQLFTFGLQKFNEEECIKPAVVEPSVSAATPARSWNFKK